MATQQQEPSYAFSLKYDHEHAQKYYAKHDATLGKRLSTWRERQLTRQALNIAGNPVSVLDLPCGTGRFWAVLAESASRKIYVADNSQAMIDTGMKLRHPAVVSRIEQAFRCSAFATGLTDSFVECVSCIRLLHHIYEPADRIALLCELARLTRKSVILSVWVDGNLGAWQRERQERRRQAAGESILRNRLVIPRARIEAEFDAAGLEIVARLDVLKWFSKKRFYVLRLKHAKNM